jgi:hypothetical protein
MNEFMTLREFMELKDPISKDRSAHRGGLLASCTQKKLGRFTTSSAEDILMRYDIAKTSWEKYGPEGPPIGTKVVTLVCVHREVLELLVRPVLQPTGRSTCPDPDSTDP